MPSNQDVAAVFSEMAELLALRGGDRHRVRAFQNAARVISYLPDGVERMLRYGTLASTPGVGDGTVSRVKEILRRGTCTDLERLRAALPPGLRELVKLKGLGPSTVRLLYKRYRISTLEELEHAARSGLLAKLPRFGVDRIHNVLREIEAYKRRRGKVPLIEARTIAGRLADELRDAGALEVTFGGSVRRWKPMIGDLDILAAGDDARPLVERFAAIGDVETVLSRGEEGASVRLADGRQADFWVFPLESWGAGLHAFSGCKEHVVAIRQRAGRMGLHVSEHGVSSRADGQRITTGRHEEEIFAAVGLPFIVPELRQFTGEIEAAEEGRLPVLVTAEDLKGDLHMHTRESDGQASAAEMVRAAAELGYEYVAVTDHSPSLGIANGLDERRLAAHVRALRRLEQDFGRLHVLAGTEVDILPDGSLDYDRETLAGLDWVVASVHENLAMDRDAMTERVVRALESGLVDCLGHPTGRVLGRRDPYALDLDRVLDVARRTGVAVEASCDPYRMDLDGLGCRQAREMGVPVVISTDAHSPAHLRRREYGLGSARRGWLEKRHVLNTQGVETIREHRAARLRRHGLAVQVARTVKIETAAPAKRRAGDEGLVTALRKSPLEGSLAGRLRSFLETGDDPGLEAALGELGANPVQLAFNLLMKENGADA